MGSMHFNWLHSITIGCVQMLVHMHIKTHTLTSLKLFQLLSFEQNKHELLMAILSHTHTQNAFQKHAREIERTKSHIAHTTVAATWVLGADKQFYVFA